MTRQRKFMSAATAILIAVGGTLAVRKAMHARA